MELPSILVTISKILEEKGARAIVVGGSVRDHFLKMPIKDYDVEVYGVESLEALASELEKFGSVNSVGKSFGVLKFVHEGEEYDFSFPRTETKVGQGHRGFDVEINSNLDFKMASKRRDFTLNAMGYDIGSKQFLDPYNGLEDIKRKTLRHIDVETFKEDPLRVYRAVQFASRFGYKLSEETYALCKEMVSEEMLNELPKERVFMEWKKLLLKSTRPSIGFELMKDLGIMQRYFPELHTLVGVVQSPKWHPEGDVWVHTMMTLDCMASEIRQHHESMETKKKLKFLFAILCHDLGKALSNTIDEEGVVRSIGHEYSGLDVSKKFLYRLMDEHDFIDAVLPLVEHHLKPSQFYADNSSDKSIRRLATKVSIEELVLVAKADFLGRTTKEAKSGVYKAGEWLLEKAAGLNVKRNPLVALIQGRDLIALGLSPSPKFKMIIDAVYKLQLDGSIITYDEAIAYLKNSELLES